MLDCFRFNFVPGKLTDFGSEALHGTNIILSVDSPFFSTIVLFKTGRFPQVSGGFLERKIPGMNGGGSTRIMPITSISRFAQIKLLMEGFWESRQFSKLADPLSVALSRLFKMEGWPILIDTPYREATTKET